MRMGRYKYKVTHRKIWEFKSEDGKINTSMGGDKCENEKIQI